MVQRAHVGVSTARGAHVAENCVRDLIAGYPEIDHGCLPSISNDRVREADLAIQLKRGRLYRNRATSLRST